MTLTWYTCTHKKIQIFIWFSAHVHNTHTLSLFNEYLFNSPCTGNVFDTCNNLVLFREYTCIMALWWSVPASLSDLAHCCVQALRTICFVFIMDQSKYIYISFTAYMKFSRWYVFLTEIMMHYKNIGQRNNILMTELFWWGQY